MLMDTVTFRWIVLLTLVRVLHNKWLVFITFMSGNLYSWLLTVYFTYSWSLISTIPMSSAYLDSTCRQFTKLVFFFMFICLLFFGHSLFLCWAIFSYSLCDWSSSISSLVRIDELSEKSATGVMEIWRHLLVIVTKAIFKKLIISVYSWTTPKTWETTTKNTISKYLVKERPFDSVRVCFNWYTKYRQRN